MFSFNAVVNTPTTKIDTVLVKKVSKGDTQF